MSAVLLALAIVLCAHHIRRAFGERAYHAAWAAIMLACAVALVVTA